jgi:putative endonuclease
MFIVFALKSENDGRVYVGFTQDLSRRLKEHNSGKTRSTKGWLPWNVIYTEEVDSREKSRAREIYLKSGMGKEFLKSLK